MTGLLYEIRSLYDANLKIDCVIKTAILLLFLEPVIFYIWDSVLLYTQVNNSNFLVGIIQQLLFTLKL